MTTINQTHIDQLRTSIDVLVRVLKITDSIDVESARRLNPPDVQTLLRIGDRGQCIATDISKFLNVAPTTTSSIVDRLSRRGLVTRDRSDENRRIVHLTLTEQGQRVRSEIIDAQNKDCAAMLALLDTSERELFVGLLEKVPSKFLDYTNLVLYDIRMYRFYQISIYIIISVLLIGCARTPPAELVSFNQPPTIPDTVSGISHTEKVSVVGTPNDLITYLINLPLEEVFEEVEGLPAVDRTEPMTPDWGRVGTERRVILADGHQAAERLLEIKPSQSFRYQVWGFTNSAGSFARYAVGNRRRRNRCRARHQLDIYLQAQNARIYSPSHFFFDNMG